MIQRHHVPSEAIPGRGRWDDEPQMLILLLPIMR
jgi:hypothetical protein